MKSDQKWIVGETLRFIGNRKKIVKCMLDYEAVQILPG